MLVNGGSGHYWACLLILAIALSVHFGAAVDGVNLLKIRLLNLED